MDPPAVPAEVRVVDYLWPAGPGTVRKRFRVEALRWIAGRLEKTAFANTLEVLDAMVVRWLLSTGGSTESYRVLPDGRVRVHEVRSWQRDGINRDYPGTIGRKSKVVEWTTDPNAARHLTVRLAGAESITAGGQSFETVVFEVDDGLIRYRTWLARDFGEVQSEVYSGPVRVSRRTLVSF